MSREGTRLADGPSHRVPDIAARFFPERGVYSSRDPEALSSQMDELVRAGVGVVVLALPSRPGGTDEVRVGGPIDQAAAAAFDAAEAAGLKVAFLLHHYSGQTVGSSRSDIQYCVGKWGRRDGIFRDGSRGNRPWVYFHDSYRVPASDWATLLTRDGSASIRGSSIDAVVIGLYYRHPSARDHLVTSGFDGVATYFASDGFTEGSRTSMWGDIGEFCRSNGLAFVPAVAPGYDDLKTRPWNKLWRRERGQGGYYAKMWNAATSANADAVVVNSYNDWNRGTQIEPAAAGARDGFSSYSPGSPVMYLEATARHAKAFIEERQKAARPAAARDEL